MEHGVLEGLEERIDFLNDTEHWSKEEIENYQFLELKKLLTHAYDNVPFYRTTFDEHNFSLDQLEQLGDIRKLPFTDKLTIKSNAKDFVAENSDLENLSYMTTGGSTGNPLKIFVDENFTTRNHANTYFYMNALGYDINADKSVRLHGDVLSKENIEKKEYWDYRKNKLVLSSYHLTESTCKTYLELINEFKPVYIHAYPSAIWLLYKYMKGFSLELDFELSAIICDSERLYTHQREALRSFFDCPVYQVYGHTEGSVMGISCKHSDLLHIVPQIGIFELLNKEGQEIKNEGEIGEIVVTGFNNTVMPFIRYKTGDLGVFTAEKCACNRNWQSLIEVQGRKQDYVVDKNGALLAMGPTLFDYNFDWSGIDKFQIVQESIGDLCIKIKILEKDKINEDKITHSLTASLEKIFGINFNIQVLPVENIDFTKIGKFRYLDQKLNIEKFFES